jgi:hypothetical protein
MIQEGAAAVPAFRQEPVGHARQVEDDFAATVLDHVPIGQRMCCEPDLQ